MFAVHDVTTGFIHWCVDADVEPEVPAGMGAVEVTSDPNSDVAYVLSGVVTARPTVPAPSPSYDLTALPAGTTVQVWNEAGDTLTITELTETLTLSDPGEYQVHVAPPWPYQPIKTVVEVS